MILVAPLLLLSTQGGKVDAPLLEYQPGSFVLTRGGKSEVVGQAAIPAKEPTFVPFRRDNDYAVWDARGLTVRHGTRSKTHLFGDVPTSTRFFDHDTVVETVAAMKAGTRQRDASALSGALRLGPDAFFLVRWDDKAGKPWAEVLVKVHLSGNSLSPQIVGRFDGLSIAYKAIDNRLFLLGGKPSIVARQGKSWGLASWDPASSKFDFRPLGAELMTYLSTGPKTGYFVEKTAYDTTLGGRVDLGSGYRKPLFEVRGNARFLDALSPSIAVETRGDQCRLHNVDTGAQLIVPTGVGIGRVGDQVVVWTPAGKPSKATAYDSSTWKKVASWSAPR